MHKVMFSFVAKSDHFLNVKDINELRNNIRFYGEHYILFWIAKLHYLRIQSL